MLALYFTYEFQEGVKRVSRRCHSGCREGVKRLPTGFQEPEVVKRLSRECKDSVKRMSRGCH